MYVLGAGAKLWTSLYNNEQLYYKTSLILILKDKQQNKKIVTKQ